MKKDFDTWNTIKKVIERDSSDIKCYPKIGEVWMSSLGLNIGFEQDGGGSRYSRPVLIVHKFNNHMFWSTPLSRKQKKFDFYYNFVDQNNQKVSVILAQLRLISVKRLNRKLYDMSSETFLDVKSKLKSLFE